MKPEQQKELLRLYREVHDRHPDQPDITYSLALLNDNAGNTEKSLSLVNDILESHDNFQPAVTLKGKLLYDLERNEEAINYLRRQTRRFPDNRRLGTLYARLLVNAGRLQAAEDEFQSLMERFPKASSLKLSRALVAWRTTTTAWPESCFRNLSPKVCTPMRRTSTWVGSRTTRITPTKPCTITVRSRGLPLLLRAFPCQFPGGKAGRARHCAEQAREPALTPAGAARAAALAPRDQPAA